MIGKPDQPVRVEPVETHAQGERGMALKPPGPPLQSACAQVRGDQGASASFFSDAGAGTAAGRASSATSA
ncbi:hypothetical protein, partial [Leptothrix ochracea]|uniref:hypothetical protein n=1 Tax=Leptothrix ochracea TaxID=735331 RepID=UPI001C0FB426